MATKIQILLASGIDLDAKDTDGQTALFGAAQEGHEGIVGFLIEHGADIEAKDSDGQAPICCAIRRGH
jgi:uncharacterized protein